MTSKQLYQEFTEKKDEILLNLVNLPKGKFVESRKYPGLMIQTKSIEHKRAIKEIEKIREIQNEIIPDSEVFKYSLLPYWRLEN